MTSFILACHDHDVVDTWPEYALLAGIVLVVLLLGVGIVWFLRP